MDIGESEVSTVVIRGATLTTMNDVERAVDDEAWRARFKEQVLAQHDVAEEALDQMLDEAGDKARELVRLIS